LTKHRVRIGSLIVIAAVATTAVLAWILDASGAFAVRGTPALLTFAVTESGGSRFVPLVLGAALAACARDRDVAPSRRRKQAFTAFLLMAITLPATALVNEFVVKPTFAAARPSHHRLAAAGIIPNVEAFYRLDRHERQHELQARLSNPTTAGAVAGLGLHPIVLRHWAHETGFSFPSSHALNAFVTAVLFLGGALAVPTPRRRRLAAIMLVWAIAVSLSRVSLLVHRPLDVAAGAAAGAVVGAVLLLPWRRWTREGDQKSI